MSIEIKTVKGYYYLDSWVMANIIQQSTLRFCREILTRETDPCGRMFDQMTMAARSAVANIAEGASRRQTSRETEMRLTDVARGSLSELLGDYFSFAIDNDIRPWEKGSVEYQAFSAIRLDRPHYGQNIEAEAFDHIRAQMGKFSGALLNPSLGIRVNANMALINRCIQMLQMMMARQLEDFKSEGGFTENMTKERLTAIKQAAVTEGAPLCPVCGKPMVKRMARKGRNSGREFWSCSDYPACQATRSLG